MFGYLLRPSRLSCVVVLLALAASAAAGRSQSPGSSAAFMFDEDYFSAGGDVELDKRIEGDTALAGGRIALRGPVKGDVLLAGGDINVTDTRPRWMAKGRLGQSGWPHPAAWPCTDHGREHGRQGPAAHTRGPPGRSTRRTPRAVVGYEGAPVSPEDRRRLSSMACVPADHSSARPPRRESGIRWID